MLCIKAPCQALSMLAEQKKGNKQRDRQELRAGWGSALPAAPSALSAGLSLLLPSFLALWLRLPSYATRQPQQKGGMWHWHKRLRDWRKLLGCRVTTLQWSEGDWKHLMLWSRKRFQIFCCPASSMLYLLTFSHTNTPAFWIPFQRLQLLTVHLVCLTHLDALSLLPGAKGTCS